MCIRDRYTRLVRTCARPFFLIGGDNEDLTQEGMVGLIKAVREYDAEKAASFRTFAEVCIRNRLYSVLRAAARDKHLSLIHIYYGGGPVGLETLSATIGEESVTLEDVYEPYLMQLGFITRTPRGRCVTQKAYRHLHRTLPGGMAPESPMDQLTLD